MLLNRRDAGVGGFQSAVIDIIMATNADHKAILHHPSLAVEEMQAHLKTWIDQDYCRRFCTTDVIMCIGLLQMIPSRTKLHADLYDEFIDVYDELSGNVDQARDSPYDVKGSGSVASSAGQGINRFKCPMFLRLSEFLAKRTEKKDGLAEMAYVSTKSVSLVVDEDVLTDRTHDARATGITELTPGGNAYPPEAGEANMWKNYTKLDKETNLNILPTDRRFVVHPKGKKIGYTSTTAPCAICANPEYKKRGHGTRVWCSPKQCSACQLYGHSDRFCFQQK
jgi:hypothetical protein